MRYTAVNNNIVCLDIIIINGVMDDDALSRDDFNFL